ncbi:LPS assembly protein LptD [Pasteurellaceae bacterium TAE3-ERU1]|nr:LPS assembly protein LptD [Pasteurellaceae bacterium TAE3-ERU1]
MKRNQITLLTVLVCTALYANHAAADLKQQCLLGVPHFEGEKVTGNVNDMPVYIEADRGEMKNATQATYSGDVQIQQGNRTLHSEHAQITTEKRGDKAQRYAFVNGALRYQDDMIALKGRDAKIDLNSKDSDIRNLDYQFVDRQGRGSAEQAEMQGRYRTLRNATFTSCLPDDNAWSIEANEIRQDLQEEVAEMWGARFRILGVPVLYTPYWQFPLGDRRRSGLLMPDFGSSSRDGLSWGQPIYWNIAPNYDATITPKYMSKRGLQLLGEFRYLTTLGLGKIAGEYLAKDRLKDYIGENKSRHLFYWQHSAQLPHDWRLAVDFTRVSDKRYFSDFTSQYGSSTDGYATQQFKLSYYQPNYNLTISGRQFQVFDIAQIGPYRALPQVDFHYYSDDLNPWGVNYALFAQAVHFDNDSKRMPSAWRFHLEPELNLPLSNQYASLNLQGKVYATHYVQKQGKGANAFEVQSAVTRVLPQFKADLETVLLTNKTLFKDYSQTIEPRVQYLYRPYKNQSNIGAKGLNSSFLGLGYDSALLQQDYFSMFRDRRYSGLDRIASANQVTLGGTTRLFDNQAQERFNLSLGQIYYLRDSKVDESAVNSTSGHSSSSWALESNWKINPHWDWRGSYQYDTTLSETSLANMALEYNPSGNNLVQLSYRYASKNYIDQNLLNGINRYNQDIKQVGATFAWDVSDNWAVVGRYYHDVALGKPVEQYAGIQYNTCCWNVTFSARRYLTSSTHTTRNSDKEVFYDNAFGINFQIQGLGTNYNSDLRKMLSKGMLPYVKPFSL